MESSTFWNPESTVLESGIHSMESRIQECPGFPYMGRNKCGATKRKQEVSSLFRINAFNVNNQYLRSEIVENL